MRTLPAAVHRIADEPRFVGYDRTKKPVDPKTGGRAKVNASATWGTFAEARAWADRTGGYVGVVAGDLVVVDLDGAVEGARPVPFAAELMEALGCDADVSVGGAGLHLHPEVLWDDELRALLPRLAVFKRVPIKQVEFRTGNNGTIVLGRLCRRATKTPAEQTAALKEVLRQLRSASKQAMPRRPQRTAPPGELEVTVHVGLAREAKARGLDRDYQTGLILRSLDGDGAGFLDEGDALAGIAALLSNYKHPLRAAKRRLDRFCLSPFGERRPNRGSGRFCVAYRSDRRVADGWGVELGRQSKVKVGALAAFTPARLIHLAVAATRNGDGTVPLPTSRSAKRAMSGVGRTTQWRADVQAGVKATPNYLLLGPHDEVPWHRHRQQIRTKYGPAVRIPDATVVPVARPRRASTRPTGRVQENGQERRYHGSVAQAIASGTAGAFGFDGMGVVGGKEAGLWRRACKV